MYTAPSLKDSLFVGHIVTDLDSVAGAIGGAELYEGKASIASNLNGETRFALQKWKAETPPPIEEAIKTASSGVCLVDHQQLSQLNPVVPVDKIVGIIDHHALQNATIVTDKPIFVDIRPWGSMSTIIAHTFFAQKKWPTKSTAGMLLCAIISDTLNLNSPTTTDWDRKILNILMRYCGVKDQAALAKEQFMAKSQDFDQLSPSQLVAFDLKKFSLEGPLDKFNIGVGVIETVDSGSIISRKKEIIGAIPEVKAEKGMDFLLLVVVCIYPKEAMRAECLIGGPLEAALATEAFHKEENEIVDGVLDLGMLVSRKKDLVPALTRAIKEGWTP